MKNLSVCVYPHPIYPPMVMGGLHQAQVLHLVPDDDEYMDEVISAYKALGQKVYVIAGESKLSARNNDLVVFGWGSPQIISYKHLDMLISKKDPKALKVLDANFVFVGTSEYVYTEEFYSRWKDTFVLHLFLGSDLGMSVINTFRTPPPNRTKDIKS